MKAPPTVVELVDGRELAFDDVGDRSGSPIVSIHGTPDSRLARHPDDSVAASLGVRLIAVDRPGFGFSSAHRDGTVGSFADDLVALADHLGLDRFATFGWSAGATYAVGVAARHADRVSAVGLAAGLVPFAAYSTPGILDGADGGRHAIAELGAELGAAATALELAPYLVPLPITQELAVEHLLEGADALRLAELQAVPGALEQLAAALVDSVRCGTNGLVRDLELQVLDLDVDLAQAIAPVTCWYGTEDRNAPVAFGHWYTQQLPDAKLVVLQGAGHCFVMPHWAELLSALA